MDNGTAATPGRILVVEDDPVSAMFVTHVLAKRGGFDVTHTPDPRMALEWARSQAWDLVITDVEMPGMTGIELLEQLRRSSSWATRSAATSTRTSSSPPPGTGPGTGTGATRRPSR